MAGTQGPEVVQQLVNTCCPHHHRVHIARSSHPLAHLWVRLFVSRAIESYYSVLLFRDSIALGPRVTTTTTCSPGRRVLF